MLRLFWLLALCPLAALASADFPSPLLYENSLELKNTATVASYSPHHKQADWVFYPLSARELQSCTDRGNSFRPDPRLPREAAATLSDYNGSGYDRGHLSPAGDNKFAQPAMSESFLLSNISPQPADFNRGIWAKLENLVRAWAKAKDGLWVTTGPVLRDGLGSVGKGHVSVPEYFYKALTVQKGARHESIAFLMPTDAHGDLGQYEVTVKHLEIVTGLRFLDGLPDADEVKVSIDPAQWNLRSSFTYYPCRPPAFFGALSGDFW